ncbi:MAG: glycoside hydrolase family 113 [Phycisphaerae bacterium]
MPTLRAWIIILLGAASFVAACSATSTPPNDNPAAAANGDTATPVSDTRSEKPASRVPASAARIPLRGVAIQINWGYDVLRTYTPILDEIAATGANSLLLSTAGYMEHAKSQAIFLEARRTPAKGEMIALIKHAQDRGLKVILMPIVLLSHPRGSEWRGVIEPPDWPDWWRQYRDFIRHFADIAAEGEADGMMVGSELVSTEKNTAEWIKVIEIARERFRKGKLGYSANWDHYDPVKFWDKLDFIGMTSYYTLADKKSPSVDEIVKKWEPIRDQILKWREATGKPLILTEVGWCSQEGAAMAPWNYYQNQTASAAGLEEQRRLYEAFIKAWGDTDGLHGVMWWEWTQSDGGPGDFSYTPKNKPAEQVMRQWFAELKPAASRPPP